ncbi:MAG TPA: cupin domain-containing protein [Symbiobacteriaceae bacterium]|nr:cupin domain-containing protein [Symbiobacteriaceae bacterium]
MYVTDTDATWTDLGGGIRRKIMAHAGGLMLVRVAFDAGAQGARHSHPHEQVTYVARGRFAVRIGDAVQTLDTGDSFYAPPHAEHEVLALEAGELVDIFTPQREDFLGRA